MPGSKQPERTAVAELVIDLALATDGDGLPTEAEFRRWVGAAIGDRRPAAEVSIRVVSAAEMQGLNQRWRGMDRPTNVLAFPAELPDSLPEDLGPPLLGDIVLCRDRVLEEARHQGKPAVAHWAHLTIHGTRAVTSNGCSRPPGPGACLMQTSRPCSKGSWRSPTPRCATS